DEVKSKETQYNIGGNIGYFYNWVIGTKVNIAPYLAVGVGGKFSSYRDLDEVKSKETQYNIGGNIGYFYNWVIGTKVNIAP
ncbi:hypothetical protein BOQ60_26510, partial [Chryseobacterium sp. CH1]